MTYKGLDPSEVNSALLVLVCEKLGISNQEIMQTLAIYMQEKRNVDRILREIKEDEGYNA